MAGATARHAGLRVRPAGPAALSSSWTDVASQANPHRQGGLAPPEPGTKLPLTPGPQSMNWCQLPSPGAGNRRGGLSSTRPLGPHRTGLLQYLGE